MLHLLHCNSSPMFLLSHSSIENQKRSLFQSGFRVFGVSELLEVKTKRRNGGFGAVTAVEKDSEFEVDPDKAREALRKLDEQLQSLSNKQIDPPKIRAVDLKRADLRANEETTGFSGSFLAAIATILLVFTIFYNILFLTVIKPSIDGDQSVFTSSNTGDNQEATLQQLSTIPEVVP